VSAPRFLDHLGRGIGVEDAGLGPGQRVLQRVIDHVRQVARGKGRRGARAQIAFGDRDDLDLDAGFGGEVGGHGLLPLASRSGCSSVVQKRDAEETSAEIIAVTADGMTLVYSDSPAEVIGFIDISDPSTRRQPA
jgi:hypothetical protein